MAEGVTPDGAQAIARVLEMMHPMREPPQPASLAPLLATSALGIGLALAALVLLVRARRRRGDLRDAALAALARTRTLAPAERLAAQAALLRRLVRERGGEGAARTQGQPWLQSLDAVFATRIFTEGVGTVYGDALYGPHLPDVDALDATLTGLFRTLRTGRGPSTAPTSRSPSPRTAGRRPAA